MKRYFFPLFTLSSVLALAFLFMFSRPFPVTEREKQEKDPNDWLTYQRAYPNGTIKPEAVIQGMLQAQELRKNSPRMRSGWQFAGPTNVGGRITDVEVPKDDSTVVYVAGATGGILKSTDNCLSWESIFDDQPVLTIGDIAIDPTNSNILYAGTGEANSSTFSFIGNGIYKSTDAGASWTHIGLERSSFIGRIVVDYANPQRLFVAACGNLFSPSPDRGIYRSDDGGATWNRKLFVTDTTSGIDIVQHPTNPDILYASMWERRRGLNYRRSFGLSSGIYKSTDGGDSWEKLTNGMPTYPMGRIGLAIAPSNPDVVYAFCDDIYSVDVFKTTNAGLSWTQVNDASLHGMNSDFGWYFGQVRVDPHNADRAYVMGVELWRTDNGGSSWTKLAGYDIDNILHVDHHAMCIDPVSGRILEGNDGGLFRSYDMGVTWQKFYHLPLSQFYEVEIDYENPNRLYGGTQDNNTIRTFTGNIDQWYPILGGDGFYCQVDYKYPNIIYAEYQNGGLCKSIDGGNTWEYLITWEMQADRKNWSMPFVMHPTERDFLFLGTQRVWVSYYGGSGWEPISGDLTKGDDGSGWHTISTMSISTVNTDLLLVGTDDGKVHYSDDAGFDWYDISAGLPDRYVTRVLTDPTDENIFYVTLSGFRWDEPIPYVFRSVDKGATWENISGNLPQLPVNAIAVDPQDKTIIVGTDAGIFFTKDTGLHWYALAEGIGNVPVYALKIHAPTRMLVAGTHGRSAYKISLDDIQVGFENTPVTAASLNISPNPFMASVIPNLSIKYSLPLAGKVDISIIDLQGNLVRKLRNSMSVAGEHELFWNGTSEKGGRLSNGLYFCRLRTEDKTIMAKVMLIGN